MWLVIEMAGAAVVAGSGLFLVGLGVLALIAPGRFGAFLLAFAQDARVHFIELAVRVIAGAGFLACWPRMQWGELFRLAGWILVATSLVMALVPWQSHRRFANWAVPKALSLTPVLGVCSISIGALVIVALVGGNGD